MSFKSHAQKKRMGELVASGFMTQAQYDEHSKETDHGALPERVEKPKKVKSLIRRKHTRV